jgi:acyl carrier protein
MSIEEQIKEYIARNILFSENGYHYSDEASLLEEGIVDSVAIMELVAYIEESMQIQVKEDEITPDNFDSITRLANYVRRKKEQA